MVSGAESLPRPIRFLLAYLASAQSHPVQLAPDLFRAFFRTWAYIPPARLLVAYDREIPDD